VRNGWVLIICGFVGLVALGAGAAEKPPAEYAKAMKEIDAAAQKVEKAIKAEDYETVSKSSDEMIEPLKIVQTYWTGKSDEAVTMTEDTAKASIDLTVSADLKSAEGVTFVAKQLAATCEKCHTAHRESLPDGSFEIK
jgi:hypothetical protein